MSNIIDSLFLELGITGNFEKDAGKVIAKNEQVKKEFDKTGKSIAASEKSTFKLTQSLERNEKQGKKNIKQAKDFGEAIRFLGKSVAALGAIVATGTGITSLAQEATEANIKLDIFSKNLGISRNTISNWQGAAELAGGSAQGMNASFKTLSDGLNRFAIMGDDSILKFFSALDIMPLEASGKIKDMNALMMELADKFSSMDRVKAFSIAQSMGIDEDTFSLLSKGRTEISALLSQQGKLYRSRQQDIETSEKLNKSQKMVSQQFEAMKLMIGNAAAPALLALSEKVEKFFSYLLEHEGLVQGFFLGLSGVITAALIPTLLRAAAAAWSFMAPFLPAIVVVAGLAAAFGLLYEDYQTWAKGGDSEFNWGKFIGYIDTSKISVKSLKEGFSYLLTGYKSWEDAVKAGKSWLELKGFLYDGELSVDSLINGFTNLTKELLEAVLPTLQRVGKTISKLLDGDFEGAWEDIKSMGSDAADWTAEKAKEAYNAAKDRVTGAIDYFTDHDPNSENSLTQGLKPNGSFYNKEGATGIPRVDESGVVKGNFVFEGQRNVEGLSQEETGALAAQMVKRESGGNLRAENQYGYLGLYQFGAAALVDAGLLDEEKYRAAVRKHGNGLSNGSDADIHKAFLADSSNWTIRGGREAFLSSKAIQDNAIVALMNKNVGYLGSTYQGSSEHKAGLLMAAHLKGAGGAKAYANSGVDSSDGNGTKISDYYNTGRKAILLARKQGERKVDPSLMQINENAYASTELARNSMINQAQSKNINNNNRTDIVINGGVNVQSSASTIAGTTTDAVLGIQQGVNIMSFNNGLS